MRTYIAMCVHIYVHNIYIYVYEWGHSCLRFGLCLFICSKWLCPVIYERKFKFLGTRKGDEAGLEGARRLDLERSEFPRLAVSQKHCLSTGSLGAQKTETPFWDLHSDSHSQQTFPRCTAENCHKNTKALLFKAEFQEPKSHSLLYKCLPARWHAIKK